MLQTSQLVQKPIQKLKKVPIFWEKLTYLVSKLSMSNQYKIGSIIVENEAIHKAGTAITIGRANQ